MSTGWNPGPPALGARDQLRLNAEGILAESLNPNTSVAAQAYSTGNVYGQLVGLRAGDVVSGIAVAVAVPATGTAPTVVRVGIANSAGTMLAVSANVNATAFTAVGVQSVALTAPYTILASGAYFLVYIIVGAWGTQQPTFWRGNSVSNTVLTALAGGVIPAFVWAGQADLPAVNGALTISTTTNFCWYLAAAGTPQGA